MRLPWYATYRHTAKIMFSEEISKTFQLLATLQNFFSTLYDKFKSITPNNDIISRFGSICLLLVIVIDEIRKFEIWLKNVLWSSKHGVPLGCTSLVVSQHFSEFLYGIYWWALAPVYVFAGDTVRDFKISLKKCKKSRKNKEIACPVNFWNKKNVPDVYHTIFWFYRKTISAPESPHKKLFFLEIIRKNFMTKSKGGGGNRFYLVCPPPWGPKLRFRRFWRGVYTNKWCHKSFCH